MAQTTKTKIRFPRLAEILAKQRFPRKSQTTIDNVRTVSVVGYLYGEFQLLVKKKNYVFPTLIIIRIDALVLAIGYVVFGNNDFRSTASFLGQ